MKKTSLFAIFSFILPVVGYVLVIFWHFHTAVPLIIRGVAGLGGMALVVGGIIAGLITFIVGWKERHRITTLLGLIGMCFALYLLIVLPTFLLEVEIQLRNIQGEQELSPSASALLLQLADENAFPQEYGVILIQNHGAKRTSYIRETRFEVVDEKVVFLNSAVTSSGMMRSGDYCYQAYDPANDVDECICGYLETEWDGKQTIRTATFEECPPEPHGYARFNLSHAMTLSRLYSQLRSSVPLWDEVETTESGFFAKYTTPGGHRYNCTLNFQEGILTEWIQIDPAIAGTPSWRDIWTLVPLPVERMDRDNTLGNLTLLNSS